MKTNGESTNKANSDELETTNDSDSSTEFATQLAELLYRQVMWEQSEKRKKKDSKKC